MSIKKDTIKLMIKQKIPKKYKNDDLIKMNIMLRVPMNTKRWDWNDYRNIDNKKISERYNNDTNSYLHIIHQKDKKVSKYGYLYLLWSNTYRELHDILIKDLNLNNEFKNINIENVNFKEVCRSILMSVNDEMKNKLYWDMV